MTQAARLNESQMWACGWKLFLRRGVALGQGGHHILQAARWIHDDAHTLPKFKNELRRLYKLIHPDLLHNFPAEQVSIQLVFLGWHWTYSIG